MFVGVFERGAVVRAPGALLAIETAVWVDPGAIFLACKWPKART